MTHYLQLLIYYISSPSLHSTYIQISFIYIIQSLQEEYETSCPTISQSSQPTVNSFYNITTGNIDITVGVPFETYALYQISFSENEISEYSNVNYNYTFPNSEGATDAAQFCYDTLTYLNLSYWSYRVDSCNYINWYLSLPEDSSVFITNYPAIWITLYNKNGEVIQKTQQQINILPQLIVQPQIFNMPNQINGQLPQVHYIINDESEEELIISIPSYVNISDITISGAQLISYTVNQANGIIIYTSLSSSIKINITYYQNDIQTQNYQLFQVQLIGVDPVGLRNGLMYPQLNISVADDKYIVSNISQNTLAYKCNGSDLKSVFSNNMTISKKCQVLTLYTAYLMNDTITTIQQQNIEIGSKFQLYGSYTYRKGDIYSTEQVMPGTVCDFVNYQRYLYEKSLGSDSIAGTATIIGGIATVAGAAIEFL